jgi:hypothetical protein
MNGTTTGELARRLTPDRLSGRVLAIGVPALYLVLLFGHLAWTAEAERLHRITTDCARVLLVEEVTDVDAITARLERHGPAISEHEAEREGLCERRLDFPWPLLFLTLTYDPGTGAVAKHELTFFRSEPVNLISHDGLDWKPTALLTLGCVACGFAILAVWVAAYRIRSPGRRIATRFLLGVASIPFVVYTGTTSVMLLFALLFRVA